MSVIALFKRCLGREMEWIQEGEFEPGPVLIGMTCCLRQVRPCSDDMSLVARYPPLGGHRHILVNGVEKRYDMDYNIRGIVTNITIVEDKFIKLFIKDSVLEVEVKDFEIFPANVKIVDVRIIEDNESD